MRTMLLCVRTRAVPNSFISYGDLYSTSSRLLLRSAPNTCTAEKNSLQARAEGVRMNPGEQSLRQRKSTPHGRANHRMHGSFLWNVEVGYGQKGQRIFASGSNNGPNNYSVFSRIVAVGPNTNSHWRRLIKNIEGKPKY